MKLTDLPREKIEIESADGRKLYPYQRDYVELSFEKKVLLCSFEQGLGKCFASLIRAKARGFNRLLILCPAKIKSTWRTEVRRTYGSDCLVYEGSPAKRAKLKDLIESSSIVVTNYEKVGELLDFSFDSVIIDEVHNLCNPQTDIFKAAFKLLRKNDPFLQGASGTPMRLKIENLWGVFYLLSPEFAGSRQDFLDKFEKVLATKTIYKYGRAYKIKIRVGTKNEKSLREDFLDSILFRVKRDGITSFKDIVDIHTVPMTPAQTRQYREIASNIIQDVETGVLRGAHNVLERLLRLLQASEGLFNLSGEREDSGKFTYIKEEINNLGKEEKLIIWSRFKPICGKIKREWPLKTVLYNGDVSEGLQKLAVWAFHGVDTEEDLQEFWRLKKYHPDFPFAPGEAQIFSGTVNLRSGLGINLHSASRCIFTSFDFNPNANMQAKDRIARIGQTADEVYTRFLVSEGTIEFKALQNILQNYEQSLRVLDGEGDLTYKQVRELLQILKQGL